MTIKFYTSFEFSLKIFSPVQFEIVYSFYFLSVYFDKTFKEMFLAKSCISHTLKCLSIGTPKIINFTFVSNGKLMIFRCPNIQTDYNEAVLCLNFGTPENNQFSIWDKWKIYYC